MTPARRLIVEIHGDMAAALFAQGNPTRFGSVMLDDAGEVKHVLLTDMAPVWVLRRLDRHGITVK